MNQVVKDYLTSHEIGCICIATPEGMHAAATHFTLTPNNTFHIQTNRDSRKCDLLREKGSAAASFVVGFSEEEWKTFQADGTVRMITEPAERKKFAEVRAKQFPGTDFTDDLEVAFLEFRPTWWRYTDSNTKPKTIIEENA